MTTSDPVLDALQAALAGEHAAVYAFAAVGGRLEVAGTTAEARAARQSFDVHRSRRDSLTTRVRGLGAVPVASAGVYDVGPMATVADARQVAGEVELGLAGPYAALVAAMTPAQRGAPARWLVESSVRAQAWGAEVPDFPGLPERA